ncbi:ectonucleotide pyrophosphatase/phosphodiesterase [Rhodohalobacter barkolensis]|uniref:Alkaline phosphatase family protein n=1 Tax=Rhodohalobacter barkolensis TaxID=2053187 RepID=A0A2N0VG85_9BACT|nr:ectonucleotide pyrophosphatase/phosphodiesterase [Rhodohalobacter barkolensis]PKD43170.1 alkaline phosphatase family protein [Rhodohalobacter barkolensis]
MLRKNALYLLTALVFVLSLNGCENSDSDRTEAEPAPVLLISVDGFMNKYIDRNETPNFDEFISEGVQAEYLIPVFPTKTFPNHWSLATGLYVENHGIISNSFYDYELEERFSYGAPDGQHDERWWGGEPIWVTAEKQGKTSVNFFWPGSEATFVGLQSTKWVDYDGSIPDSTRIDSIAAWFDPAGDVQADFGTLYFSFVDSRGHSYGPDSPEVDEAVVQMDGLLGYFLEKLDEVGLSDNINILLVSDHGMAAQSEEKVIFLDEIINLDDVDMVDYTPVAMIKPHEGKTDEVYRALKENEENYRVFLRDELPERFHFSNHYRIPEIIMIADNQFTITNREYFEERGVVPGMHGFDNFEPDMHTFFAAKGPAFKSGAIEGPVESVHMYELMAYLLQIEPAENDGSLDEVRKFLNQ